MFDTVSTFTTFSPISACTSPGGLAFKRSSISLPNRHERNTGIQQKAGRPVQFEIMPEARKSLDFWLQRKGDTVANFVFSSRIDYRSHSCTRQYARLVVEWVTTVGIDAREYGTHRIRGTKASLFCKATGNLRAVQILLGHTNIEYTARHLGVDIDDAPAAVGADGHLKLHQHVRQPESREALLQACLAPVSFIGCCKVVHEDEA